MRKLLEKSIIRLAFGLSLAIGLVTCNTDEKEQIVVTFGPQFSSTAIEGSAQPVSVNMNFSLPLYEDAQIKVVVK